MKKRLLAMLMVLAMLLSVSPISAFATETVTATPETFKEVLAAANNGDTIQLSAGDYGVLDHEDFPYDWATDLTIIGAEGVVVEEIYFNVHVRTQPKNLTLKNITFDGSGVRSNDVTIEGLSVVNCKFTGNATVFLSSGASAETITKDLLVDGNTFEHDSTMEAQRTSVIVHSDAENIIVKGNTIKNSTYNAIQINMGSGNIVVENNTISGTGSRAMRLVMLEGAKLTIKDNNISNANTSASEAAKNNGEVIKTTGDVTDVTAAGNAYNDAALEIVNGMGVAENLNAPTEIRFWGTNLELANTLNMAFLFAKNQRTDWSGCYAKVTVDGVTTTFTADNWRVENNDYYYYIYFTGIAANMMDEEITVAIYDSNDTQISETFTTSIHAYATGLKNQNQEKYGTIVDALLAYGAAAKSFFAANH